MSQELLDAIAEDKIRPQNTDISVVKKKAKELRDSYLKKQDLENQVKELTSRITKVERDELPALFGEAGITSITVEADGNHPPFVAEKNTVYTAKIPDDKRTEALDWFEKMGHGDLVKSVITITFGMQEHDERLRVMTLLRDAGVEYATNESVHHMTLKAFVKAQLGHGVVLPHDLLGIYIFDEVKIKTEK